MLTIKFNGDCNRNATLEIDGVCNLTISEAAKEITISRTAKEMKLLLKSLKSEFFSETEVDGTVISKRSSSIYGFENGEVNIALYKYAKSGKKDENFKRFCEDALEIIDAL